MSYPDANGTSQPTHHLTPDYQGCGLEDPPHGYDHGRICVASGAMNGFLGESAIGDTFPVGYYTADDLSFFAGCAQEWTICDRYHSGILASTQPNRMYMHCGQTDRLTTGSGLPMTSTLPTIWDTAAEAGVSAGYYFSNLPYTAIWDAKYLSITRTVAAFFSRRCCRHAAFDQLYRSLLLRKRTRRTCQRRSSVRRRSQRTALSQPDL